MASALDAWNAAGSSQSSNPEPSALGAWNAAATTQPAAKTQPNKAAKPSLVADMGQTALKTAKQAGERFVNIPSQTLQHPTEVTWAAPYAIGKAIGGMGETAISGLVGGADAGMAAVHNLFSDHPVSVSGAFMAGKQGVDKGYASLPSMPENHVGDAMLGALSMPAQAVQNESDMVYRQTGSPLAGTAANVAGNAMLFALPAAMKGKVAGSAEEVAANPLESAISPSASETAQAAQSAKTVKPRVRLKTDGSWTEIPQTAEAPSASQPVAAQAPPKFEPVSLPEANAVHAPEQQLQNIQIMHDLGLDTQRPSAIGGDRFTAGQEYQQAKLDNPMGEVMRGQLQKEQAAIKGYGDSLHKNTGATAESPEEAGQIIRGPARQLSNYYDAKIKELYDKANKKANGSPSVELSSLNDLLQKNSLFAGKMESSTLRKGIRAYLKEQDAIDKNGNMQQITPQTAEGVRQYLNSQWSPQNSGLIGKLKEAVDKDALESSGSDLYKQARALHAERKNTLDNPAGISSVLSEEGPNGINQRIPDEKLGAKLLSMPTRQFQHILDTYRNLPAELQPEGKAAINEIRGALAKKIYEAGDRGGNQNGPNNWNAANVTRALKANASKMAAVFSPEEMANFEKLNKAGYILQTPSAYPGAAAQGYNLVQRGAIVAPRLAGTALGSAAGGVLGAITGERAGNFLSGKAEQAILRKKANKLEEVLSNPKPINKK